MPLCEFNALEDLGSKKPCGYQVLDTLIINAAEYYILIYGLHTKKALNKT